MKQCCDIYTWLRRFVESCSCTLRATCAADQTGRKSSLPSCGSNARPAYSAKHIDFLKFVLFSKQRRKLKKRQTNTSSRSIIRSAVTSCSGLDLATSSIRLIVTKM